MTEHLTTWTPTEKHPCTYSPEVLAVFARLIPRGTRIHDSYAGTGKKLGSLADEMDWTFSGTDLQTWPEGMDPRLVLGNATDTSTYPTEPYWQVTSPTYGNRNGGDYSRGPTPRTRLKGRRSYTLALGGLLHPENTARWTIARDAERYWASHAAAVSCWSGAVATLVNVDLPIVRGWEQLLIEAGFRITEVIPVYTQRHGGLANADVRPDHEVVIVATKEGRITA